MSNLPPGFDNWLTRIPEGPEEPEPESLVRAQDCHECGGAADYADMAEKNYILWPEDGDRPQEVIWKWKHFKCPPIEEIIL